MQNRNFEGPGKAARLHRMLATLYLLAMLVVAALVYYGAEPVTLISLHALASGLVLMCLLHAWLARGSRMRRPNARLASILIGFVMLPLIPIGTIFGILLIGASWSPWPSQEDHPIRTSGAWPQTAVRDRPRNTDKR